MKVKVKINKDRRIMRECQHHILPLPFAPAPQARGGGART